MCGTTKKRRGNATASRKTTPYVMRNLELKLEERMRNKRKFDRWKRRQEQKLKKNTEVLDVSELLRKKVPKEPKKKKKLINIQEENKLQVKQGIRWKSRHTCNERLLWFLP